MHCGDWRGVGPVELVCPEDGVLVPVGPVDPVLEDADAERVAKVLRGEQNNSARGPRILQNWTVLIRDSKEEQR